MNKLREKQYYTALRKLREREQQTLDTVRAELRAMVEEEELNAKPHAIYSRRNGCIILLTRYNTFADAAARCREEFDTCFRAGKLLPSVSEYNTELARFAYTNEHGTMWIYVAPCG
jgi:hypothetical protein